jgi:DNA-directed RNA polymerase beta' subunit
MNTPFEILRQRALAARPFVPRKLTEKEIDDICSVIPYNRSIPEEIARLVQKGLVDKLREQLVEVSIVEEGIPELKKNVMEEYYRSLLQPGEMVGVQAATSIGEPVSQMTLNAFHNSGISSIGVAAGVPRVEEILNASKKPKSSVMNLFFKENTSIQQIRKNVFHTVTEVVLSSVVSTIEVNCIRSLTDLPESEQLWYQLFMSLYACEIVDEENQLLLSWRIRLHLDRNKMFKHSITCLDVGKRIENSFRDLYVVCSPDNIGVVDVFIDFDSIKLKKKEEQDIEVIQASKEIRCINNVIIPYLNEINICGIPGIEDVYIHEDKGEWVVDTRGTNLYAAFANESLDYTRCKSSDIWEVLRILGVEATRNFIIEEFFKVLSVSGASVGRRHIELLADSMTYQGKINSVNRYGIDRNQIGPMAKASFEESVRNFFIAAVNGESDNMGVSSSLMGGKLVKCGTGFLDVRLDHEMLKNVKLLPDFVYPERKEASKVDENVSTKIKPLKSNRLLSEQTQRLLAEPVKPDTSYKPAPPMKPNSSFSILDEPIRIFTPTMPVEKPPSTGVSKMFGSMIGLKDKVVETGEKPIVDKSARTKRTHSKKEDQKEEPNKEKQSFMKKKPKKSPPKEIVVDFEDDS